MAKVENVKHLLVVGTYCTDPNREEEFNNWYNGVHIPDMMSLCGKEISKIWRYKNMSTKPTREWATEVPQYLAIYELNADDPRGVWIRILAENDKWQKEGRVVDCLGAQSWGEVFELIAEF